MNTKVQYIIQELCGDQWMDYEIVRKIAHLYEDDI